MTLPPRIFRKRKRDQRLRSPEHLRWVRTYGCIVPMCNMEGRIDAAHVKTGSPATMGMKPPDDRAVSMCRDHHQEMDNGIGEPAFQKKYGVDLDALAKEFADTSPPLKRLRKLSAA